MVSELEDAPTSEPILVRTGPRPIDAYPADALEELAETVHPETVRTAVVAVYQRTGGGYVWSDGARLGTAGGRLIELLRRIDDHGVLGSLVRAGHLARLYDALDWNQGLIAAVEPSEPPYQRLVGLREQLLARLDAQLTAAALALARLLDVTTASGEELATVLPPREALEDWVHNLLPWHPQYQRLTTALARYRRYSPFPRVRYDEEAPLAVGASGDVVATLRRRLAAEGFSRGPVRGRADRFDAQLAEELSAFQYTRGLPVTGKLDTKTVEALNVPVRELVASLRRALATWRKSPIRHHRTFLQVNLPEFTAELYYGGERVLRQRIVIGYPFGSGGGRTKLFHSQLDKVMINPGWTPSDGIIAEELLPKERESPGYLKRAGFRWFTRPDGRKGLYQLPGDKNALGRVVLRFENDFNIYLHGSPDQDQFDLASRAFSHGCVRVQAVEELAIAILTRDGAMSAEQFETILDAGKQHGVPLRRPLPIHFEYTLVTVDDDDQVRFLPNIYRL